MYTGRCLCGGIRFRVEGDLAPIQICHCKQCQRAQGTVLATNVPVDVSAFEMLAGAELLRAYESTPGKQRCFCSRCGSPIFSKRESLPDVIRIRIGLLDGDIDARPIAHFHVADKPVWWPIDDDLPQYAAGMPQRK